MGDRGWGVVGAPQGGRSGGIATETWWSPREGHRPRKGGQGKDLGRESGAEILENYTERTWVLGRVGSAETQNETPPHRHTQTRSGQQSRLGLHPALPGLRPHWLRPRSLGSRPCPGCSLCLEASST